MMLSWKIPETIIIPQIVEDQQLRKTHQQRESCQSHVSFKPTTQKIISTYDAISFAHNYFSLCIKGKIMLQTKTSGFTITEQQVRTTHFFMPPTRKP